MPADRAAGPVVLLGFDAADPDLVERWVREGKLPSMARLMDRGTWSRTTGADLLFEHGIEVPIMPWPQPLLRVSAQLYNTIEEYEKLKSALDRARA